MNLIPKKHASMAVSCLLALTLTTAVAAGELAVVEDNIETQYETIRVVKVAGELEHPWAIAFLPDASLLVTERPGHLNKITQDGEVTRISGLPNDLVSINQGGLLDVELHPDYEENGWIYITYSKGTPEATATTLIRAQLEDDRLVNVEEVFTQDRKSEPGRHYGSRLAWTQDGKLLMSIGDRGVEPERAQDLQDHAGKLLRLNADGSMPEDNPFVDRDDAHPEIYSYGHRNIQGLIVHPETGAIWANEHGPRGGDELNFIEPGKNYGWPVVSKGRDYRTEEQWGEGRHKEGMVPPVYEFLPTLAPSGFAVVMGDLFPAWQGNFMIGGLPAEKVRRVVIEDQIVVHEEELIRSLIGRVRDVRMGPDDFIYVATDEPDGGVYRIEPAP